MDNLWIASLADVDRQRLEPHLRERPFAQGQMLYDAGEEVDEVWFPLNGVVSLMTVLPEDRLIETAAIGREGLVGVTCGPMNGRASSRAIAQIEGAAACCSAEVFSTALGESDTLRNALSRYTESLFAQVQQTAACNAQHRLDVRLARWLLTLHDRAEGDERVIFFGQGQFLQRQRMLQCTGHVDQQHILLVYTEPDQFRLAG